VARFIQVNECTVRSFAFDSQLVTSDGSNVCRVECIRTNSAAWKQAASFAIHTVGRGKDCAAVK